MGTDPASISLESSSPRPAVRKIFICSNGNCAAKESAIGLYLRMQAWIQENEFDRYDSPYRIKVFLSGCLDICEKGPVLVIQPDQIYYWQVDDTALEKILIQHLLNQKPVNENIVRGGPQDGNNWPG